MLWSYSGSPPSQRKGKDGIKGYEICTTIISICSYCSIIINVQFEIQECVYDLNHFFLTKLFWNFPNLTKDFCSYLYLLNSQIACCLSIKLLCW